MAAPVSAFIKGERVFLSLPDYHQRHKAKAIAGYKWDAKARCWVYPRSPEVAKAILAQFPAVIHEGLDELAASRDAAQQVKEATDLPPFDTKLEPWLHQKQAFWFAKELDATMLAMDMGTGKSKVTIDLICNTDAKKILIICPKKVISVWPAEFEKHSTKRFTITPMRKGTVAEKRADAEIAKTYKGGDGHVFIVNYESAWRQPLAQWLLDQHWDVVVLDESHKAKSPGGKASMFLSRLADRAKRRLCLTGTPMPNSPADIYGQYRFLDKGIFGTSKRAFENQYAIKGGYQDYQIVGWRNEDEMNAKIHSIAYFVDSDVLDLIPPVDVVQTCHLEPDARKVYDEMSADLIADIDDGTVTAANALVKLLRLQQITGGHIIDDDKVLHAFEKPAKAALLRDTLDDIDFAEPIVVFARFRHDLDVIREVAHSLDRPYMEISGKKDELAQFQERPESVVLGVQIQAGGFGIDLTMAKYCIYYSLGFSLGDYEQSRKRTHRPGQKKRVVYIHLLCERTVDEDVMSALREKRDIVDSILHRLGGGDD